MPTLIAPVSHNHRTAWCRKWGHEYCPGCNPNGCALCADKFYTAWIFGMFRTRRPMRIQARFDQGDGTIVKGSVQDVVAHKPGLLAMTWAFIRGKHG